MVVGQHQTEGTVKWSCYQLYVLLDVYSRYFVGWTIARQRIDRDQRTIHADHGRADRNRADEIVADRTTARALAHQDR